MLENPRAGRTRGRQAEAAANDERILDAALRVLIANPKAPITEIADAAGVGVASLYRRFTNRDDLARRLALHAMAAIEDEARDALDRIDDDPPTVFRGFFEAALEAGAGSMNEFAGTFTAGAALNEAGQRLHDAIADLLLRAQQHGIVRADVTALDVLQLFEMLRTVRIGSGERSAALRRRYIEIIVNGLHPADSTPLCEPGPAWDEVLAVWNPGG